MASALSFSKMTLPQPRMAGGADSGAESTDQPMELWPTSKAISRRGGFVLAIMEALGVF